MPIQLKPSEFDVPPKNPFANDKLDRKKCTEQLTKLVQNTPGPLVISINGGWGTGKTVFLRMWKQDLQDRGFTTIYFNAWQDDYCHDPLIALMGQMWNELKDSDFKEIAESVKECAGLVFRTTVFNAVRTATCGVVDLNEEQLKSVSEKAVDEYIAAGERLKDLKRRLCNLAQQVQNKGSPLMIIIDELDRCRPTFAIELLEKVKHLFDTPGILFVLGIDREQLAHSIKCVYGQEMDVNGYLRRFIDIEFILPETKRDAFISHLFAQFGLDECFEKRKQASKGYLTVIDDKGTFDWLLSELCSCFQLSLRDMEHCCRLFALAYLNTNDRHFIYPPLLMILAILKLQNSELYYRYVSGRCNSEEIISFILDQPPGEEFLNTDGGHLIDAHLLVASPLEWRDGVLSQMQLSFEKKALTQPGLLPDRIKKMNPDNVGQLFEMCSHFVKRFEGEITHRTLGCLSKKIELASLMLDYRE